MTQHILALNSYLLRPIEGLLDLIKTLTASLKRRKIYNATVKELSRLTDAELNDIGLNRGDIRSVARADVDMNPNLRGWV